ncbi:DUF4126 family protein [Agrococcus carbonis]|uniref:Uncharacterized membrane protein n=1 Tax=Agrococcus carbonis TaxID=684552 RepID=A0A1H1KZ90_9MICO|nr:DUF4126 family protein [Agrococcus carbonis]SDR67350.1 Uncharacterized membrane protein [Agrococcus carbonis]
MSASTRRILLLGVSAGMRSFTPLAALARTHDRAPGARGWRRWPVLRSRVGRAAITGMAALELVGDKSPAAPSRLAPPALLGRASLGAIAGAALASEAGVDAGRRVARGAVLGALGAVLGAMAALAVRSAVVERTPLPDPAVAVLEDAAAIALARASIGA